MVPLHPRLEQRQRLDRPDERVPLDELPVDSKQPVQFGRVEGSEAAPEDEVLRRRDGRDRVELEEPDPADSVEDAARRAVDELRPDGDPAGLLDSDLACRNGRASPRSP